MYLNNLKLVNTKFQSWKARVEQLEEHTRAELGATDEPH
jgi:hypothetical protein